ncbi:MAG: RES family NAD+ phosphorylase [Leptothrix sp. (in: b-proteobacteria)]
MISVWRIGYCPSPPPTESALLASLGLGSTLGNGRWHTRGPLQVVYAASSRALCQLEKRVHSNGAHPKHQALMQLDLPDGAPLLDVFDLGLPADWRSNEAATQAIGMSWTAAVASLGLWVPSFVEPGENNLILNPAHPQYRSIRLSVERQPFRFDPRLF